MNRRSGWLGTAGVGATRGTTATLRIDDLPEPGAPRRLVTVDCPHGTTRLVSVREAGESARDPLVVGVAFVKHYRRHRCHCLDACGAATSVVSWATWPWCEVHHERGDNALRA